MDKGNHVEDKLSVLINQVYDSYKNGAIEESASLLNEAHSIDFDNPIVLAALKCTRFWIDRFDKLDSQLEDYEKGEFLVKQWIVFTGNFVSGLNTSFEDGLYNLKQGVFRTALKFYARVREGDSDPEP